MLFSSPIFLGLFLPLLLAAYCCAPARARNAVLLAGSLFFYAWGEPKAVLVMLLAIVANHALARRMSAAMERGAARRAKALLAAAVALNLAALLVAKYLSFLIANINGAFGASVPDPKLPLPIGISFYIFQIVSYQIDVFRREVRPARSAMEFALYVSLFPQLVAGPIVRYSAICNEMRDRALSADNVALGLRRFSIGLAKKVLLADTFALVADTVFESAPGDIPRVVAWGGILAYSLQIFYDFSGYSDMAIGLGRVFNFRFPENFDHPYGSTSMREFWRRWHISLSTWFRDYLYFPLGGSRAGTLRTCRNLFVVFLLCGLWHGASWNFAAWGMLHGAALAIERLCAKAAPRARVPRLVGNLYVWLFAMVAWVFFRAPDMAFAFGYLRAMFGPGAGAPLSGYGAVLQFWSNSLLLAAGAGILFAYPRTQAWIIARAPEPARVIATLLLFIAAYSFAMTGNYSPFIYFKF